MGWHIDTSQQNGEADRNGNRATSIGYLFDRPVDPLALAISPESFLGGELGNEPLPRLGSAHPVDPHLKLDKYSVTRDGNTSRVVAAYSNTSNFTGPPTDDDPETNRIIGYASSRTDVVTDIPYGKRINSVTWFPVPADQSGPPNASSVKFWKLSTFRIRESRRTRSWKVLIAESEIQAAEETMDKQDNRLHNILGTWYLYKSSDVTPTGIITDDGTKLFEITHSWTRDGGTPFFDPGPTVDEQLRYWFEGFSSGLAGLFPLSPGRYWLRPPFHAVNAAPSENGFDPPVFKLVLPYLRDDNGWRTLPGLNL